jgi:hypothetical protein
MNKALGLLLKIIGIALFILATFWAFGLTLQVVQKITAEASTIMRIAIGFGFLILLPITLLGCVLYAFIAWGEWLPIVVSFGDGL